MSMPLPDAVLSMHTLVLGKTRAGKSSVMRLMVERLLDQQKPVCILDPKGDWWGLKSSADGKRAGYPVVIFGGEHADVPINQHSGAHVAELVATGNRPALIDLGGWMVGERTRFFIAFASAFFRHTRGPRWLVIDEVHNFAPQGKVIDPDAGKMLHWANRLASEGAGKGVTLISASQRPQKVHKDYVTSHETLVAMRVIHELDRNANRAWMDGHGDSALSKQVLDTLAAMERGEGWVWSPEAKFGPKRIRFPMFSTYDSFAAPKGDEHVGKLKGWAEVDLDEVKEKLAAVVEEAKANDPAALKMEVARLRRELAGAQRGRPAPVVDEKALQRARDEGFRQGALSRDDEIAELCASIFEGTVERMRGALDEIAKRPPAITKRKLPRAAASSPPLPPPPPAREAVAAPQRSPAPAELDGIGPSQMKIVEALAFWESLGIYAPTRDQVAGASGFAPGGTFRAYVGKLANAGLVENAGVGALRLTDYGRAAAPPVDVRRTARERVGQIISASHARILDAMPRDGSPISREELAAASGFELGGTFRAYVGKLNTLGIIRNAGVGQVAVEPWVWS